MRQNLSRAEYLEGIISGDRAILARAITLVESSLPDHVDLAQAIVLDCLPHAGNSVRVGISGAPGVGKSSVIEALGRHVTEQLHRKLAVLAIDPSSRTSQGSILADKTRMEGLANNERAFIRPSPSGNTLGGVARHTRDAIVLCEAAGYDNVIVETVGVGQSETMVHSMVDFFLLLVQPGAGDELQAVKRGIMEIADLVAVNKADGPDKLRAEVTRADYAKAVHLFPERTSAWTPRAVTCSAHTGEGIAELWEIVSEHNKLMRNSGVFAERREEQVKSSLFSAIEHTLLEQFRSDGAVREQLPASEREVLGGRMTCFQAALQLVKIYRKGQ